MGNRHSATKVIPPQTLRGFRDFLPDRALQRQYLIDKLQQVFELYGYDPIETPALEQLTIFEGQIGTEEKLFYKFQDPGRRWVALRYDQTVPTARFVAQHHNQIGLPFKRYQIQTVWRAERPQKGRYREFLQADADLFGVHSPQADAEVIALSLEIYRQLGFKEVCVLINDRTLYKNIPYPVVATIDKLPKIGQEKVIQQIVAQGFSVSQAKTLLDRIRHSKPTPTIQTILAYLRSAGFPTDWYRFEPTLARAFSYSTGPIWEVIIPGFSAGSVLGGERYDKLVGQFGKQDIPGTGFGLGFDRTLEAMERFGLLPEIKTRTKALVTIMSAKLVGHSLRVAQRLREAGINTDVYPNPADNLQKQLKYAHRKGIPWVFILGPEELEQGQITLKDMHSGEQSRVSMAKLPYAALD